MSLSSWSYTADLTFWPVTLDDHAQPTYGAAQQVKGTWATGGDTQTDDAGEQFVPMSTYWTTGIAPARGWLVAVGLYSDPPAGAEMVRKIGSFDDGMFGEASDVVVYT